MKTRGRNKTSNARKGKESHSGELMSKFGTSTAAESRKTEGQSSTLSPVAKQPAVLPDQLCAHMEELKVSMDSFEKRVGRFVAPDRPTEGPGPGSSQTQGVSIPGSVTSALQWLNRVRKTWNKLEQAGLEIVGEFLRTECGDAHSADLLRSGASALTPDCEDRLSAVLDFLYEHQERLCVQWQVMEDIEAYLRRSQDADTMTAAAPLPLPAVHSERVGCLSVDPVGKSTSLSAPISGEAQLLAQPIAVEVCALCCHDDACSESVETVTVIATLPVETPDSALCAEKAPPWNATALPRLAASALRGHDDVCYDSSETVSPTVPLPAEFPVCSVLCSVPKAPPWSVAAWPEQEIAACAGHNATCAPGAPPWMSYQSPVLPFPEDKVRRQLSSLLQAYVREIEPEPPPVVGRRRTEYWRETLHCSSIHGGPRLPHPQTCRSQ